MIKAVLRDLHSPDASDLKSYVPDEPTCFSILLQVFVGSDDSPGQDSFDVVVCTPTWLAKKVLPGEGGILVGRHYLIVEDYDFERIEHFLMQYVNRCTGETWQEVAEKVGRLGKWEFEDYHKPHFND